MHWSFSIKLYNLHVVKVILHLVRSVWKETEWGFPGALTRGRWIGKSLWSAGQLEMCTWMYIHEKGYAHILLLEITVCISCRYRTFSGALGSALVHPGLNSAANKSCIFWVGTIDQSSWVLCVSLLCMKVFCFAWVEAPSLVLCGCSPLQMSGNWENYRPALENTVFQIQLEPF